MLIGISGRTDSGKEQLFALLIDLLRPIDDLTIKFISTKEELKAIEDKGGYTIRIEKDLLGYYFTNGLKTESNLPYQETELDCSQFDYVLINRPPNDLSKLAEEVATHLKNSYHNPSYIGINWK